VNVSRNIPSLDGIRAVSVLIVILAHSQWFFPFVISNNSAFKAVVGNGQHGVAFFFVISGYLITTLLLREFDETGKISLLRFYFRRTLRIFPPFYVLLAILALLFAMHVLPGNDGGNFAAVATYTVALIPLNLSYFTAHTWSLSVEEIFYLVWPFSFLLLHKRANLLKITLLLIFSMPIIRLLLYVTAPNIRGHEFYMIQGWLDTMMGGCWLALLKASDGFGRLKAVFSKGWLAALLCLAALYLAPLLVQYLPKSQANGFSLLISPSLVMVAAVVSICYLVDNSTTLAGRFVNLPFLRWVGALSYSVYLWQQIFMSERLHLLPWGYVYAAAAAMLSYWLIEKPSYTLRFWIESNVRCLRRTPVSQC